MGSQLLLEMAELRLEEARGTHMVRNDAVKTALTEWAGVDTCVLYHSQNIGVLEYVQCQFR